MINYDQLIWEACGSPTTKEKTDFFCKGEPIYKETEIEITLAHVMQLLAKKLDKCKIKMWDTNHVWIQFIQPDGSWKNYFWILLKQNNEAANLADQSDKTKEAICKILNLIGDGK